MAYRPPLKDYGFLFRDVLKLEDHADLAGFADAPLDLIEQIVGAAGDFTANVLAPLNGVGDKNGCKLSDGAVTTPPGFKAAYEQLVEGG